MQSRLTHAEIELIAQLKGQVISRKVLLKRQREGLLGDPVQKTVGKQGSPVSFPISQVEKEFGFKVDQDDLEFLAMMATSRSRNAAAFAEEVIRIQHETTARVVRDFIDHFKNLSGVGIYYDHLVPSQYAHLPTHLKSKSPKKPRKRKK